MSSPADDRRELLLAAETGAQALADNLVRMRPASRDGSAPAGECELKATLDAVNRLASGIRQAISAEAEQNK